LNHRFLRSIVRFRFKRIRSRVVVAMIALSVPPLFLLGYLSYNIARDTLLETNTKTNADHLRTSSEVADLLFRNITNLSRAIVLNGNFRDGLADSMDRSGQEQSALRMRMQAEMQKLINNNFVDSRHIESICLYNLNYDAFCLGRTDDAGVYEGPNKQAAIREEQWHRAVTQAQGRVLFFSRNVLGDSEKSFSTVKLYRDPLSRYGDPIGLVVINISKSIFGAVFSGTDGGGEFLAVDGADIVYPLQFPFPAAKDRETFIAELEEKGYLVSRYRNETTRWTFLHLSETEALLKQSNQIGTVTALIASSIALVAILLSFFISGTITRPLLRLKKMMAEWRRGARDFEETFQEDEVGEIGETFKRMASENVELNERLVHSELKEREAELRALQAQIKPHFLYNTLDSIYWMATLNKNPKDIAKMAIALSESFKLSLNKGQETIPVFKELKHVEHYMTIQNIRYNYRFTYIQEVDESIMGVGILKLLLQPLVENAIYHGLEPKAGPGTVRIAGAQEGDMIVFAVEDDGVGIEDLAKTEQGYGLRNVRERLKLYYGASGSIAISSKVGSGTKIVLRLRPER